MLSVGLNAQKSISSGALPGPHWGGANTTPPDALAGVEGIATVAVPSQEPQPRLCLSGLKLQPFWPRSTMPSHF